MNGIGINRDESSVRSGRRQGSKRVRSFHLCSTLVSFLGFVVLTNSIRKLKKNERGTWSIARYRDRRTNRQMALGRSSISPLIVVLHFYMFKPK